MSDSDSSSLSSAVSTDDEAVAASVNRSIGIDRYFKPKPKPVEPSSPPPPKRAPSPPHEYVLADNPDIAFIVMFRSRFADAFPKSCPNYGPQDIESGVTDPVPGDHIERLLCALIGLVLNRKKDVERGHYQRALEEAIQTNSSQWPKAWNGKNPLHGGGSFTTMSPDERLAFLKTLILWALSASDAVQAIIKENYKRSRHDDDLNQPLSVQPWGRDAYKRRYWLIEGQGDTHFRLYRESNPALKHNTWWSVAGSIPELKSFADSLAGEKSQHARRLSEKIYASIPRFEGSEEKRKRRDYRLARKAAFARPEPGFSLYEGRTRGKKLKYTFSDEEDDFSSDAIPSRKSTRFQSRVSTPGEPAGPTYTASGRQVRARVGGAYGESALSGARRDGEEVADGSSRRTRNSGRTNGFSYAGGYNDIDEMDDDEPEAASSGNEWNGGDEDANDYGDDDEEMSEASSVDDELMQPRSLVVQLRYGKGKQTDSVQPATAVPASTDSTVNKTGQPQDVPSWPKTETSATPAPKMSIDSITTANLDILNGVKQEQAPDMRQMPLDNITTPNVDVSREPQEAVKQNQAPTVHSQQPMQIDTHEQQQRPPGPSANIPSAPPTGVP